MEIIQKQGGPYTKNEQDDRRKKVYTMYFEQGFSAIKIGNELKINRHITHALTDKGIKFLNKGEKNEQ